MIVHWVYRHTIRSEILKANNLAINADYITISPIFDSISKENYSGMDKNKFIDLCTYSALPVFAMGGIDENNISQAFEYGAYGIIICGSTMKNPKILNSITKYIYFFLLSFNFILTSL